ncbi:hypothetical protein FACS189454_04850 [Planctomycetales bacterium]|nr:hypothetical protein FACS189454_04850 [Planctomycetales bacterium]
MYNIIIPTYNTASYIDEMLESIFASTDKEFQVFTFDDCSTDNTVEKLNAWAKKEGRVAVIECQENAGPGKIRNKALNYLKEHAAGEYTCFFDSDDKISPYLFSVCRNEFEQSGADFVRYSTIHINHDATYKLGNTTYGNRRTVFERPEERQSLYWDTPLWNKVWKTDLIFNNRITFPNVRLADDDAFNIKAMTAASKFVSIPEAFYYYRADRPGKISVGKQDAMLETVESYIDSKNYLVENGYWNTYREGYLRYKIFITFSTFNKFTDETKRDEYLRLLAETFDDDEREFYRTARFPLSHRNFIRNTLRIEEDRHGLPNVYLPPTPLFKVAKKKETVPDFLKSKEFLYQDNDVAVFTAKVGVGELGINELGFDGHLTVDSPLVLSAHCPSSVKMIVKHELTLTGRLNGTSPYSSVPCEFFVNNELLGALYGANDSTKTITLKAGYYDLQTKSLETRGKHAVWQFAPAVNNAANDEVLNRNSVGAPTRIPVFFGASVEYYQHTCVSIISILENNQDLDFDFFIMTDREDEAEQGLVLALREQYKNCNIRFIVMDNSRFENLPVTGHLTYHTYYNLVIPELVPELEKAIYLDSDIICTASLRELWETELGGHYIAGAENFAFLNTMKEYPATIGLSPEHIYINSGVLVMNLKKIREDNKVKELFENQARLACTGKYAEQDTINYTFSGKIQYLPKQFNYHGWREAKDIEKPDRLLVPNVIHYDGPIKPWVVGQMRKNSPLREWYFRYLLLSPYWNNANYTDNKPSEAKPPERMTVDLKGYPLKITITPRMNWCSKNILTHGIYKADSVKAVTSLLDEGMTFVDIGANLGLYTLTGALSVGASGKVVAIEPQKKVFQLLERNIRKNALHNVIAKNIAVGAEESLLDLYHLNPVNNGEASLSANRNGVDTSSLASEKVNVYPLTQVLKGESITRADAMKIDVEGAEMSVLQGAFPLFEQEPPLFIHIEVMEPHLQRFGNSAADVFAFLKNFDYTLFGDCNEHWIPFQHASEWKTSAGSAANVLALHANSGLFDLFYSLLN